MARGRPPFITYNTSTGRSVGQNIFLDVLARAHACLLTLIKNEPASTVVDPQDALRIPPTDRPTRLPSFDPSSVRSER